MTKAEMWNITLAQLACDLNCSIQQLGNVQDPYVFVEFQANPGRRAFPYQDNEVHMLSVGQSTIVSAKQPYLAMLQEQMQGLLRDDAFFLPFAHGHSLYYLPDPASIPSLEAPSGFHYALVAPPDLYGLYSNDQFHNALLYDIHSERPDVLAMVAMYGDEIVAMAGASADSATMWQLGIDVLPPYRGHGLAAYLIRWLTEETLQRGFVPYYGTSSSNVASQRVAHRAGYYPAWMCIYKGVFPSLS